MPRFVILRHETPPGFARPAHWDFMLECDGVLRTWALAEVPSPGCEIAAEELADHRLAYLEYEGEMSGGRGTVSRWDEGRYEILGGAAASQPTSPLTPALSRTGERETGTIRIVLHGRKIAGEVVLSESSRHAPRAATEAVVTR